MKVTIYLSLLFLIIGITASAQDKIYKKGGEVIQAKISEVGTDEIKYKVFSNPDGPVYTIEKDRILKVVYQNGKVEIYQNGLKDPELYADQAKNAIKINFLSPLLGFTQFNFEHSLRPGSAYEVSLGIIGLGARQEIGSTYNAANQTYTPIYRKHVGLFASGGYKFSKAPDFTSGKERYGHVMQGFYAKPELMTGLYSQNYQRYNNNSPGSTLVKKTTVFGAIIMNLGKQWVMGDKLVLDLYGGLGYVVDNLNTGSSFNGEYYTSDFLGHHFGVIAAEDSGLGFSGGLKIGILIK